MQNTLSQDEKLGVWSPDVGFSNALGPFQTELLMRFQLADLYKALTIIKKVTPALWKQPYTYKGSQNSILFTREYYFDFGCNFDLRSYPFDTQGTIFIQEHILINKYRDLIFKY
jgi:hypothetical protein